MSFVLTPAHGRDYNSKKELLADLNADKDFYTNSFTGGTYINSSQLKKEVSDVQIRYGGNRKVTVVKFNQQKQEWV